MAESTGTSWRDWENDEPHKEVWRIGQRLREAQGADREADADDSLCLYFGNTRNSIQSYSRALSYFDADPPGYNVVQACVDTLTSHVVKNDVRPFFLTARGNWELKEKALGMQRSVEAVFGETGMYGELGTLVCFDGSLFEAGGVKWAPDFANLRVLGERVFPWEFFVPEREARKGNPRQGWHIQPVPRDVLLDYFKDAKEEVQQAIRDAKPMPLPNLGDDTLEPGEVVDMLLVCEYWHLPSGRIDRDKPESWGRDAEGKETTPSHDGRHIICLEEATLHDEPWPYDYFPIAWFKPRKKPVGYWSRSASETLAGAQLALNRMNLRVDGIMNLHARPLLYCWKKAAVNTSKITNAYANILEGNAPAGQALQYITPQSVPAEYLARIREIIAWAEKQYGLSELSISAQKPPGIEHAPALQHLSDEQNIRHTPAFKAWERLFVDSARMVVDCFRMLAEYVKQWNADHPDEEKKTLDVLWSNSKQLERIEWAKVDLKEDQYHLKVWPTNLLPQTPSAKAARIIEYLKAGILTPAEARAEAIEFPDIEALLGDSTAVERNIQQKLQALVRGEMTDASIPHPYLDLELAKRLCKEKINVLEADGAPEEVIGRLTEFYELATEELAKLAPAVPPMPPGPPGGVPAAPPAPPMAVPPQAPPAPPGVQVAA